MVRSGGGGKPCIQPSVCGSVSLEGRDCWLAAVAVDIEDHSREAVLALYAPPQQPAATITPAQMRDVRLNVWRGAGMVIARYASHPAAGNAANDPVTLPAYMALAKDLMAGG
jgi:hypothetical protein